jgi:archaellum component FlaC
MPTVEERVVELETRILPEFRDEMRAGFGRIENRFEQIDKRFEQMERRFDDRFNQVDKRLERLETRVERLDDRADRHFMWIVGIQFTTMIIFIGALVAAVLRTS